MSEIFYTRHFMTQDSENGPEYKVQNLFKATFIDNKLKIYINLTDSDDEGKLHVDQPFSPYHIDSEIGEPDENGVRQRVIKQFNRPWLSDSEAFVFARGKK